MNRLVLLLHRGAERLLKFCCWNKKNGNQAKIKADGTQPQFTYAPTANLSIFRHLIQPPYNVSLLMKTLY